MVEEVYENLKTADFTKLSNDDDINMAPSKKSSSLSGTQPDLGIDKSEIKNVEVDNEDRFMTDDLPQDNIIKSQYNPNAGTEA